MPQPPAQVRALTRRVAERAQYLTLPYALGHGSATPTIPIFPHELGGVVGQLLAFSVLDAVLGARVGTSPPGAMSNLPAA